MPTGQKALGCSHTWSLSRSEDILIRRICEWRLEPVLFIFGYRLGLKDLAVNAFCDFALALFPISFIKNLQIRFSSKVILVVLMSCGFM